MLESEAAKKIREVKEAKETKRVAENVEQQSRIAALTNQVQQLVDTQKSTAEAQAKKDEEAQQAEREAAMNLRTSFLSDEDNDSPSGNKLEDLSRSEFLDVIFDTVDKGLAAHSETAGLKWDERQKALVDDIAGLRNVVLSQVAQTQVAAAREEFKDFDDYKEAIGQVVKAYPGINITDAYILAKSKAAGKTPPTGRLETEKPTGTMTHAASSRQRQTPSDTQRDQRPRVSGIRSFRSKVGEAIDKVIAARGSQ